MADVRLDYYNAMIRLVEQSDIARGNHEAARFCRSVFSAVFRALLEMADDPASLRTLEYLGSQYERSAIDARLGKRIEDGEFGDAVAALHRACEDFRDRHTSKTGTDKDGRTRKRSGGRS